jgi:hypothetical protein
MKDTLKIIRVSSWTARSSLLGARVIGEGGTAVDELLPLESFGLSSASSS